MLTVILLPVVAVIMPVVMVGHALYSVIQVRLTSLPG